MTKEKLIAEIEERVKDIPGQSYGFTQPIQMRMSELVAGVKSDIGIKVFGEDLTLLKQKADTIAALVGKIPGAQELV